MPVHEKKGGRKKKRDDATPLSGDQGGGWGGSGWTLTSVGARTETQRQGSFFLFSLPISASLSRDHLGGGGAAGFSSSHLPFPGQVTSMGMGAWQWEWDEDGGMGKGVLTISSLLHLHRFAARTREHHMRSFNNTTTSYASTVPLQEGNRALPVFRGGRFRRPTCLCRSPILLASHHGSKATLCWS